MRLPMSAITIVLGLVVVGCTSAPVDTAPASLPSTAAPGRSPGETALPSNIISPAPAQPTPAQSTGGPLISPTPGATQPLASPGSGAVIGGPFVGDLAAAFPRVINGVPLAVAGPLPASELTALDELTLELIAALAFDPSDVEAVYATNEGSSLIVFALRFEGVDSATLDSSYVSIQEGAPGTGNFRVVSIAGRNVHAFDGLIGTMYSWVNSDILFTAYGTEGGPQAVAALPVPTVALEVGGEQLPQAEVDLVITGGAHAGNYHGVTPGSGGCSRNALGEDHFGLQYTNEDAADGFTSLQLILRDAAAAGATGTDDFVATVQLGSMSDGTTYNIDPANGDGSGTITLDDSGDDAATVVISGETADGVQVDATVTCNLVYDFGG